MSTYLPKFRQLDAPEGRQRRHRDKLVIVYFPSNQIVALLNVRAHHAGQESHGGRAIRADEGFERTTGHRRGRQHSGQVLGGYLHALAQYTRRRRRAWPTPRWRSPLAVML
eukprot:scaffold169678_cov33-Prasinocladus_malaysianus.AAC.3